MRRFGTVNAHRHAQSATFVLSPGAVLSPETVLSPRVTSPCGHYTSPHPPPTRRRGWRVHPKTLRHVGLACRSPRVPHCPPPPSTYTITVLGVRSYSPEINFTITKLRIRQLRLPSFRSLVIVKREINSRLSHTSSGVSVVCEHVFTCVHSLTGQY